MVRVVLEIFGSSAAEMKGQVRVFNVLLQQLNHLLAIQQNQLQRSAVQEGRGERRRRHGACLIVQYKAVLLFTCTSCSASSTSTSSRGTRSSKEGYKDEHLSLLRLVSELAPIGIGASPDTGSDTSSWAEVLH
eukprot:3457175-Rhodomonas_salina.1